MLGTNARWSLVVSRDTDIAVRQFLISQGSGRRGEMSRFVEEAVCAHLLDLAAHDAKAENANLSQIEIDSAIEEALTWARQ